MPAINIGMQKSKNIFTQGQEKKMQALTEDVEQSFVRHCGDGQMKSQENLRKSMDLWINPWKKLNVLK